MTKTTIETLDDNQLEQVAGGYIEPDWLGCSLRNRPGGGNIGGQQGEEVGETTTGDPGIE